MNENNNDGFQPLLSSDDLLMIASKAEQQIEAIQKIKRTVLKLTNEHDWCDQNGKPYLEGSGCEKIAGPFGIGWRDLKGPITSFDEDGHFVASYTGTFVMHGREIEATGSRSSKDEFFSARYRYNEETKKKEKYIKPPSEIEKRDVQMSAYTNLLVNGISRILGIRNMTYEDLAAAGFDVNKIKKVEYNKPEMTGEAKSQRDEIERILNEMSGGDDGKKSAILQRATSFVGTDGKEVKGKDKIDKLSEKQIPITLERLTKGYEEWKKAKANGQSGDSQPNN